MLRNSLILFYLLVVISGSNLAQQTGVVDFTKIKAVIEPNYENKSIVGNISVSFKVFKNTDSIYLDAVNMQITDVALEGTSVSSGENKIWLVDKFEAGREYQSFFTFSAKSPSSHSPPLTGQQTAPSPRIPWTSFSLRTVSGRASSNREDQEFI